MATYNFDVPDWVPQATGESAETFLCAMRLAAAMFWYGRGEVSQGTAAAVAGLDRTTFLLEISKHKQDIFGGWDAEELEHELSRVLGQRTQQTDG